MIWLLPLLGFLLGSIPFGLLMGKLRGIDIREHGSGNIGATNVFRTLGKGNGIVCLLLDFLKGMIPVIIASNMCKVDGQGIPITIGILREWNFGLISDQLLLAQIVPVVTALPRSWDTITRPGLASRAVRESPPPVVLSPR